jgi:hypothetical protein
VLSASTTTTFGRGVTVACSARTVTDASAAYIAGV